MSVQTFSFLLSALENEHLVKDKQVRTKFIILILLACQFRS